MQRLLTTVNPRILSTYVRPSATRKALFSTVAEPASSAAAAGPMDHEVVDAAVVDEYRRTHQIHMRGRGLAEFNPLMSFQAVNFHPKIMSVVRKQEYVEPTPIQAQSWPLAMQQRDMISVARTGSGKTCAFLLPALQRMMTTKSLHAIEQEDKQQQQTAESEMSTRRRSRHRATPPRVLVLAPTRELCVQIGDEAKKYGYSCGVKTATIYGGASKGPQIREIEHGAQIIIATPGRCVHCGHSCASANVSTCCCVNWYGAMMNQIHVLFVGRLFGKLNPPRSTIYHTIRKTSKLLFLLSEPFIHAHFLVYAYPLPVCFVLYLYGLLTVAGFLCADVMIWPTWGSWTSARSNTSCWTRRTACWIWVSSPRLMISWVVYPQVARGRHSSSVPRGPKKYKGECETVMICSMAIMFMNEWSCL
jgi:hypothetical protein